MELQSRRNSTETETLNVNQPLDEGIIRQIEIEN